MLSELLGEFIREINEGKGLERRRAHSGSWFDLVSSLMDVLLRANQNGADGKEAIEKQL